MRFHSSFDALGYEIAAEKAASLGRVAAQLEESLVALAAFDAAPAGSDGRTRAKREELVAASSEWLWFYVVQREALGWNDHEEALALYHVPAEVRMRMGPRRSKPE
jgi:hypothetical protein